MHRHRVRVIASISAVMLLSLGLAAGISASDRIPVSSVDDASLSLVNRIAAVDDIVLSMDARLGRILGALADGQPPSPVVDSLDAARTSFETLIVTIDATLCNRDAVFGSGDASLADGDIHASDVTTTGLANQLGSVGRVLLEANGRIVRIVGAYPPGPPVREVQDALIRVRADASASFESITARLGDDRHPPSPCVEGVTQ